MHGAISKIFIDHTTIVSILFMHAQTLVVNLGLSYLYNLPSAEKYADGNEPNQAQDRE